MSSFYKAISSIAILAVSLLAAPRAQCQRLALKTNTIDWIALSPNLAGEAAISPRISLQLNVSGKPFKFAVFNTKFTNWRVEPELRYWFNRPMARHFIALSATVAGFSMRHKDHNFVADAIAAGISYGYALVLSDHWNMEAELGVGLAQVKGYDYRGSVCPDTKNYSKVLPVPIRVGLSFSYIFK